MSAAASRFPAARYAERLTRAAELGAAAGLDALLVTPGPDLRYLLGSRAESFERLTCLVIPTDGSAATQQTNRIHGTVRRELLATVLHELTHIYDRARLWSSAEKTQQFRCRNQAGSNGLVGLPGDCRGQTQRRFTLSDDPRLLDLAGWPQYVGRRGQREHQAESARYRSHVCPAASVGRKIWTNKMFGSDTPA